MALRFQELKEFPPMAVSELLWPFVSLPETYVAIDTETTGLFNGVVAPDAISMGITKVDNCKLTASYEFRARAASLIERLEAIRGVKALLRLTSTAPIQL